MKNLVFICSIITCISLGCTKDKTQKNAEKTLCSVVWKCQSLSINGSSINEPCALSDQMQFKTDGSGDQYIIVKCDPSSKDSYHFKWKMASDGKTVYIQDYDGVTGDNYDFSVVQLTKSTFEYTYKINNNTIRTTYISK